MKLREYLNNFQIPETEFITINNVLSICDYVYKPTIHFKEAILVDTGASHINNVEFVEEIPPVNSIIMCRVIRGEISELFHKCKKNKNNQYIVMQQPIMDDGRINKKIVKAMPDNVVKLYAKNVEFVHERIHSIPIGRDFRNEVAYRSVTFNSESRTFRNLVYCNFALNTNKKNRRRVYNLFREKDWVTQVEVHEWMKYPISREEYLRQVYSHKFCLSPEGAGIDCFRTWEALYLKSIPIVQEGIHMNAFKDLPILFTKNYSEITKNYLEEKYEGMLDTDYNIDKLYFSYWKHLIMNDKKLLLEKNPRDTDDTVSGTSTEFESNKLTSVFGTIKTVLKRNVLGKK